MSWMGRSRRELVARVLGARATVPPGMGAPGRGGGAILVVAADDWGADLEGSTLRSFPEPRDTSELQGSLQAIEDASYDGALAVRWGQGIELPVLVTALARKVRPGGKVALARATSWSGVRGAVSRLLGRATPSLEDLCEALLLAGLLDIRAKEHTDRRGVSVVWGCKPS